jgi:hypothetical protein
MFDPYHISTRESVNNHGKSYIRFLFAAFFERVLTMTGFFAQSRTFPVQPGAIILPTLLDQQTENQEQNFDWKEYSLSIEETHTNE